MEIVSVTLEGQHVRLEPLSPSHAESLIAAVCDGELWDSPFTVVPSRAAMTAYIEEALHGQSLKDHLPFVIIRKASGDAVGHSAVARASARAPDTHPKHETDEVVGTTRFYDIRPDDRRVAIGYTWLGRSAQRTPVNTESKLLLLTHAFEHWRCNRVEFITDVLNQQSRAAILRLGAKEEGILRNHMIMRGGRIRDSAIFSIITSEWPEVRARLAAKLAQSSGAVARP